MSTPSKPEPRSATDRLTDGYVPSALPPQAPDGGLVLTPPKSLPVLPPLLCEQGPCRHLHAATGQLDEQMPLDGSSPLYRSEAAILSCYPSPGIELELSRDAPIVTCNRWDPIPQHEIESLESRREDYRRRAAEHSAEH
jgi:hypothetical protein